MSTLGRKKIVTCGFWKNSLKYGEKGLSSEVAPRLAGVGHSWWGWFTSDSYTEVAEVAEDGSWRMVQKSAQRCAVYGCHSKVEMKPAESAYTILRVFAASRERISLRVSEFYALASTSNTLSMRPNGAAICTPAIWGRMPSSVSRAMAIPSARPASR